MNTVSYSLRKACRIVRLSRSTIAALVDAGVVSPAQAEGTLQFSFQDLAKLRALAPVGGAQLRRAAKALSDVVLEGRQLAPRGNRLAVVETDGSAWDPSSGQLMLPIDEAEQSARVFVVDAVEMKSDDPFERGLDCEAHDPDGAVRAYRQAIDEAPDREEAWLNLGALLQEMGRAAEALSAYQDGLRHLPRCALLHFGHGVTLQMLGLTTLAADAYSRALEIDPNMVDAHYNAALVCMDIGDQQGAIRHANDLRRLQRARPAPAS